MGEFEEHQIRRRSKGLNHSVHLITDDSEIQLTEKIIHADDISTGTSSRKSYTETIEEAEEDVTQRSDITIPLSSDLGASENQIEKEPKPKTAQLLQNLDIPEHLVRKPDVNVFGEYYSEPIVQPEDRVVEEVLSESSPSIPSSVIQIPGISRVAC